MKYDGGELLCNSPILMLSHPLGVSDYISEYVVRGLNPNIYVLGGFDNK